MNGEGEDKPELVCRGGRDWRLVGGVMAMNEGEDKGLDSAVEKVEDVDIEGDVEKVVEFVLVEERVAGLIISVFDIDGDNLEKLVLGELLDWSD